MKVNINFLKWVVIFTPHFFLNAQILRNFKCEVKINGTSFLNSQGLLCQKGTPENLYVHADSVNDYLLVKKISLKNIGESSSLQFNYKLNHKTDFLSDFDFKDDIAIVLMHKKLLLFKLVNNTYQLQKTLALKVPYDKCFLNNDKINLFKCYNDHALTCNFSTGLLTLDLELQIKNENTYDTDAAPFTHLVGKYYDYYSGKFILSNALSNKFLIIDRNGSFIDSIGDGALLNNNIKIVPINYHFNQNTISPKDTISKIQNFDKSINRIFKVYYLNDSTIFYVIKTKNNKFLTYLINKTNYKWHTLKLKHNGKSSIKFNWSYSTPIYFGQNKIYFIDAKFTLKPTENHFLKYPNYYLYSYEYKFKK